MIKFLKILPSDLNTRNRFPSECAVSMVTGPLATSSPTS